MTVKLLSFSLPLLLWSGLCFSQTISQQEAIHIAKTYSRGKIENIQRAELVNDSVSQAQYWIVEEEVDVKKEQEKIKKRGMTYIYAHILKIDARTGEVTGREKKMLGSVHICPSF